MSDEHKNNNDKVIVPLNKNYKPGALQSISDFYNKITDMHQALTIHQPKKTILEYDGSKVKLDILTPSSSYKVSFDIHNINNHKDKYYASFKSLEKGKNEISPYEASFFMNYIVDEFFVIQHLGDGIKFNHKIGIENIHHQWLDDDLYYFNTIKSQLQNSKNKEIQQEFVIAQNTYLSIKACEILEPQQACYLFSESGYCRPLGEHNRLFCITDTYEE